MMDFIGQDKAGLSNYQRLIRKLSDLQNDVIHNALKDVTLTGTFLQYRGSMLNWCFVGRDANLDVRNEFALLDDSIKLRKMYKEKIDQFLRKKNIAVTTAIGGKTSIDIYPCGWDKTFALQYYKGWNVYFIGDACQEGGNDWHIYQALKDVERNTDKSYQTSGPEETIKIIDDVIGKAVNLSIKCYNIMLESA